MRVHIFILKTPIVFNNILEQYGLKVCEKRRLKVSKVIVVPVYCIVLKLGYGGKPVSYTHLDVYKRQIIAFYYLKI